ncbi:MAG TPA: PilW family protein [Polyangia bacterium]|nr:PilW family protein [Polyangia bacterium]
MKPPRHPASGLTLVELMITIIISSIVAGSTFTFFVGQRRVYDTQMKVLNTQQNLWAAMETLTRFVRGAGMGLTGCVSATDPTPTGATMPATGLRAFDKSTGAGMRLAPIWINNGAAGAPDRLTVVFGTGSFGNFTDTNLGATVTSTASAITTPPGLSTVYRTGEFIVLLDNTATPVGPPTGDRGCSLFQITGIDPATNSLQHATTSIWNAGGAVAAVVPNSYTGGATPTAGIRDIGTLNWVQFSIDATGQTPKLMMNRLDGAAGAQVLADGIEDLQIAYACDTQPAGAGDGDLFEGADAATRNADEWTYNVTGDVPDPACNRPQAVRITVIARSTEADTTLAGLPGNAKPAVEDGVAGAADTFRHRVMTTTVFPRNR